MPFKFHPFPYLETDRLILNPITINDCQILYKLRTDIELTKYIKRTPPKSIKEVEEFVIRINKQILEGKSINWRISLAKNDEMVGSICLWNFSNDNEVGEIGYDLLTKYQGIGIMSEAMQGVLGYGFEMLSFNKIVAFTHYNNKSSISLLMKNNFVLDADKQDKENSSNRIYYLDR